MGKRDVSERKSEGDKRVRAPRSEERRVGKECLHQCMDGEFRQNSRLSLPRSMVL